MFIYLIIWLLILILAKNAKSMSVTTSRKWICFIGIIFVVVFGLRYRVGIDTLNYIVIYDNLPNLKELNFTSLYIYGIEPLWVILNAVAKGVYDDFFVVQILQCIIWYSCLLYFFMKYCQNPFLAVLLYASFSALYFSTEIMREGLAVALFLINYNNYVKRRWKRYYITCLVCIMFHTSGLITLIFPLARNLKFNKTFAIVTVLFLIVGVPAVRYISEYLTLDMFAGRVDKYMNLADSDRLNVFWVIFMLLRIVIHPLLPLLFVKNAKDRTKAINDDCIESMMCMTILFGIGSIFFQLLFSRFSNYTMMFFIAYAANFLSSVKVKSQYKVAFLILSVLIYGKYYSEKSILWIPYVSVFEKVSIPEREKYWEESFNH